MHHLIFRPGFWFSMLVGACFFFACTAQTRESASGKAPSRKRTTAPPVEAGVSLALAEYRQQVISEVTYDLHLQVPTEKTAPILGSETIAFRLKENRFPLQLDFKEQKAYVQEMQVNGQSVPVLWEQEHLLVGPEHLQVGENKVSFKFRAGELSLNRNADYLYTLLVPDRARTVFPCFDQPDLKATFTLSLTVPQNWRALANAPLRDSVVTADRKIYRYLPSDKISTYLFSFAAGDFKHLSREMAGQPMRFYHRETDAQKLEASLEPIFKLHQDALAFMAEYTRIPYPFQKFDFVAIPDFQYNGMEHVGAIQYRSASLFLDPSATQDQKNNRANLIAHETAHMWFGDLVTMRWFNDVWMKEVFANFMADKISEAAGVSPNYDLKFLVDHFPAAYSVDRTAGANPIRQPLDNLQEAGSLYGAIIYHKAPIVMRQLERLMGPEPLREGLRDYLRQYAHGNASWPELIKVLDPRTPANLAAWSKVWVSEPGRPVISHRLQPAGNKIGKLVISQKGEDGSERVWPQLFEIALVYPDRTEQLTVNLDQREVTVAAAAGKPLPDFIFFNPTGQGYGVFPVPAQLADRLYTLPDPVARASAYINAYENMLTGQALTPTQLLALLRPGLWREQEELNVKLLTGQLSNLFWQFTAPGERVALAAGLERDLWQAMLQQTAPNTKKLLFKAYQNMATTKEAQDRLYQVWHKQTAPPGVRLAEDDYASLALALAVRDYPVSKSLLMQQLARIQNPDRRARLQFLMPALSGEERERDVFFASLLQRENREKEAWVVMALEYLHHPLRAASSEKYLAQSLALVAEIQQTGDIFFPHNWLQATFGAYQSPEAARTVRTFLQERPDYNPRLKAKILQATDNLLRAQKLREGQ